MHSESADKTFNFLFFKPLLPASILIVFWFFSTLVLNVNFKLLNFVVSSVVLLLLGQPVPQQKRF